MKQKITFIGLLLLSVLVFGQNKFFRQTTKTEDAKRKIQKKHVRPRSLRMNEDVVKQRLDSVVQKEYSKEDYKYDEKGNLIQDFYYDWDTETNQWVVDSKGEYKYDEKGNLIQDVYADWDIDNNQWEFAWKTEYKYDEKGNLTQEFYDWDIDNNQWEITDKSELFYDAQGNLTQEIDYDWDTDNNEWVNSSKSELVYDEQGNLTKELNYDWDTDNNEWVNSWKYQYFYDAQEKLINEINYWWYEEQWANSWKTEYKYDDKGNLTQQISYDWNIDSTAWVSNYKQEYVYDNTYSFGQLILPFEYYSDVYFNHMIIAVKYSDEEDAILYYSQQTITNVEKSIIEHGKVYPNPVSNTINIELLNNEPTALFELVDLQGRTLISKQVSTNEQLNVADLQSGYYIYTILVNNTKQSGQLIKE